MKDYRKYDYSLRKFGCTDEDIQFLIDKWNEPHRYYHNSDHLFELLDMITSRNGDTVSLHILIVAAFFHDAVYDPKRNDNEQKSAELFDAMCTLKCEPDYRQYLQIVMNIINATKYSPSLELDNLDTLSREFLKMDLHGLMHHDLNDLMLTEEKMFKEFQFHEYSLYRLGRGQIMRSMKKLIDPIAPDNHMDEYIRYIENKRRHIGVYAGSFFPWHRGHRDILKKAERVFDKVILSFGINPDKSDREAREKYAHEFIEKSYHQAEQFKNDEVFLTNYIKKKSTSNSADFTIVKGVGRPGDLESEKMQLRYMEDMDPSISIAYFVSDRNNDYVSSSGLRSIQKLGGDISEYL